MRQIIQMRNIVAFKFKARAIFIADTQDCFDVLEGVFEDKVYTAFAIETLSNTWCSLSIMNFRLKFSVNNLIEFGLEGSNYRI